MNAALPDKEFDSAIYRGIVRHRRYKPTQHEFEYPIFMFLLKTDEIPLILKRFWQLGSRGWHWARYRRQDYIGNDSQKVADSVKTKIAELGCLSDAEVTGDVFMLVHLRYFGFYFSPLNLYYLRQDGEFRYMLAEVSNTPWNERHYYLQDLRSPNSHAKAFHVSPFNPMSQDYKWQIVPPDIKQGKCSVNIQCLDQNSAQEKIFDATLSLKRHTLNQAELRRVLLRTPLQTVSVVAGIYWQALKLFIKGTPLHKHPAKLEGSTKEGTA